jgi:hypothetical protein
MSADNTIMNCEEYREAIGADPRFDGGAGHLSECSACQTFRNEAKTLDVKISRALLLDVPELVMPELASIETSKVVSLADRRRVSKPIWFAMAATVSLAAFIGFRFAGNDASRYEALATEVLAHVTHEPAALLVTDHPVAEQHLHAVVPASIANMGQSAGLITFAKTCPINGNNVPHLVIQGEYGPITILLMPNENIGEAVTLNNNDSHGVILPVGDGSIAIVGARDEKLEEVRKQVLQSVAWST